MPAHIGKSHATQTNNNKTPTSISVRITTEPNNNRISELIVSFKRLLACRRRKRRIDFIKFKSSKFKKFKVE